MKNKLKLKKITGNQSLSNVSMGGAVGPGGCKRLPQSGLCCCDVTPQGMGYICFRCDMA
jgi:hypothetical protein